MFKSFYNWSYLPAKSHLYQIFTSVISSHKAKHMKPDNIYIDEVQLQELR